MTNFYLVLFYVTLLMLSRQVGPHAQRRGWGGGGHNRAGASADLGLHGRQRPVRKPWSPGPRLPASPPLRTPVTFGHVGHLGERSPG